MKILHTNQYGISLLISNVSTKHLFKAVDFRDYWQDTSEYPGDEDRNLSHKANIYTY